MRYLAQNGCIITEHQRPEILCDDDLIRIAQRIADRIGKFGPRVHYSRNTAAANAADFVGYLVQRAKAVLPNPEVFLAGQLPRIHDLLDEIECRVNTHVQRLGTGEDASEFEAHYQKGMELEGVVTGHQEYGIFVRVKDGAKGLIHVSNLGSIKSPDLLEVGSRVTVKILAVEPESQKLSLGFVGGN